VTRKISLSVNDTPINLDYFVTGYLDHVTGGIISSLKGTGEIKNLELNIDNDGQVTINLNGAEVPLGYFATEIVKSTVAGMVAPLKGVAGSIDKLELKIAR
jgi:formate dehydrogenase assembly factor FdhD